MPRGLTGRIALGFVGVTLAVILALGGALFLVLRDLHADASRVGLVDLAGSIVPQVRGGVGQRDVRGAITEIRAALESRGVEILLAAADGRLRMLDGAAIDATPIRLPGGRRGTTFAGETVVGGERHLYGGTILRVGPAAATRAVVLVAPDRSGALALADLVRTLPFVGVVAVLVGGPLTWALTRSVKAPLARLAEATADVPTRPTAALPLEGPTEVRDLTSHFNTMAAELRDTREREGRLLANLRHDLRTPLTVIAGFAAALADGTARGAAAGRAARAIGEEADRLEHLVDELGAIEALQSGARGLRPEPLEAGALLAATLERFAGPASERGVELAFAGSADAGPAFAADRLAVERILANLVSNALAAVSPGGHVWLEGRAIEETTRTVPAVALSVTDDGPGFAPGTIERVFERFYRGDPARSGDGSGLGLAIVRELARAHGGEAIAENVAPHGARVSVVLPVLPAVAVPPRG